MFAYCRNNPANSIDPSGHFGLLAAIITTGAIVGGLLGAFSAATTGGNVIESAIEGVVTGAIGSACGILFNDSVLAVIFSFFAGCAADVITQVTSQYITTGSVEIDILRVVKVGAETGLGTAIPVLGEGAKNAVDAFGTALVWAEGSTLITCADIIVTKVIDAIVSSERTSSGRYNGAIRLIG